MNRIDQWLKRHFTAVHLLLILTAAAVYGLFSLNSLVWADEAYTFALIRHSFTEVWNITAADVHPPLYYFLLKLLTVPFGYNLMVCRFVSAIPCLLVVALGGWHIRKLFGERTAVLFMALYLLFPYTMTYAAEVRMYSLAELLILLCAIHGYRAWLNNKAKDWTLFAIFGTAAAYTHYFALVSAAMVYGLLFLLAFRKKQMWKPWLLASAGTILAYLPWLGCFISQLVFKVNNEYWIEPITFGTVVNYVLTVFSAEGFAAFPLFFGLAYVTALGALLISRDKSSIWLGLFALAVPLGTVAIGLVASILVRPVFVIRYILPSLPLAVFFFAYVLGRMTNEMLLSSLLTVALLGGISNLAATARDALITDSAQITASLVAGLPEADAYVTCVGQAQAISLHTGQILSYYDPTTPIYTTDLLGPDNPYPNRIPLESFDPQQHESVILTLSQQDAIPQEFLAQYTPEHITDVYVSGNPVSIWHLRK